MVPNNNRQTIARAYQQICSGEEPWIALGNFRNAWYGYARDMRESLVIDTPIIPTTETEHTHRWLAFCAASVEFLCERYTVICPPWVHHSRYTLALPWWHTDAPHDPSIQEQLLHTTPHTFAKRNIFCGNRLFQNKYEMSRWVQEARATGLTSPADIWHYARQKEISIHGG